MIILASDQIGYKVVEYFIEKNEPISALVLDTKNRGNFNKKIIEKYQSKFKNNEIYYETDLKDNETLERLQDVKSVYGILAWWPYIIKEKLLSIPKKGWINFHPSYLPFNKGAHPNFWSFAENTPSGVTIHKIDEGIDTGPIIFQKLIDFDLIKNKKNLTFEATYKRLINEIENIFTKNIKNLVNNDYQSNIQIGKGSFHHTSQLPKVLKSWKQNIFKTIINYDKQKKLLIKNKLEILDKIESTRKNNNINWMNILRTSIKSSTSDTLKIIKMINQDDNKISSLFKKLNDDE